MFSLKICLDEDGKYEITIIVGGDRKYEFSSKIFIINIVVFPNSSPTTYLCGKSRTHFKASISLKISLGHRFGFTGIFALAIWERSHLQNRKASRNQKSSRLWGTETRMKKKDRTVQQKESGKKE